MDVRRTHCIISELVRGDVVPDDGDAGQQEGRWQGRARDRRHAAPAGSRAHPGSNAAFALHAFALQGRIFCYFAVESKVIVEMCLHRRWHRLLMPVGGSFFPNETFKRKVATEIPLITSSYLC